VQQQLKENYIESDEKGREKSAAIILGDERMTQFVN
jgi:hypothetical protein